jgi:thioredoxin reductase
MINTVIIGAGPYGLSLAAHLRRSGTPFRIFGRPMDSWRAHMPKGMFLKSDGFASNISDPENRLTLGQFCAERGIEYANTGIPVHLETFTAYGLEFRDRMVPDLEDKLVTSIDRAAEGFVVRIDDGEVLKAHRVVLAVGITHFEHVPESLAHLPEQFLSHSARHSEVGVFTGQSVAVIGGGSSALDWAALLHEAGVDVQMVVRQGSLKFHGKPSGKPRSLWHRIQHPQTGLGPGWKSSFYANAPDIFHYLPENLRLEIVRRTLGPSGGWFIKDKVVGKVPTLLGHTVTRADVVNGKVELCLQAQDGNERKIQVDHVIAATGYKVDLDRLKLLNAEIRSRVKSVNKTPILSSEFECSVRGLFFVGVAAANSFGPVMRFAFGADFAARTVARALEKSLLRNPASEPMSSVATSAK